MSPCIPGNWTELTHIKHKNGLAIANIDRIFLKFFFGYSDKPTHHSEHSYPELPAPQGAP